MLTKETRFCLRSGQEMPAIGLGVFEIRPDQMESSVRCAAEAGYRLFDTAAGYGNEKELGKALRQCNLPREDLFVTTKLWTADVRAGRAREACLKSIDAIGIGPIDLYLIHWPVDGFENAWLEMARMQEEGLVGAIGVSNFDVPHIERLKEVGGPVPAVHQMEFHPWKIQPKWMAYARENGIHPEAYGPFMQGGAVLRDERILEIAGSCGKTPAQVILRWCLQSGVSVIPKSVTPSRIKENIDIFDFELTPEEMQRINQCNRNTGSFQEPYNITW